VAGRHCREDEPGHDANAGTAVVGRAKELENLRDALAEAAAGRGLLVLVTGEPGIGKTRLMQELAKLASVADWRVLMRGAGRRAAPRPTGRGSRS
jgi:transcriptional regulator with AAA-type ATPase domain